MTNLTFRGKNPGDRVRSLVRRLILALAGKGADPTGAVAGVQLAIGTAAMSQVYQDFLTKSRGGVGNDGVRWKPLKPETIAYGRRKTAAEKAAAGWRGGKRPLLTAAQDKTWRRIFGTQLARLRLHMGEGEAKALAAKQAWAAVKKQGGKTVLGVFGGRQVDIGRDTGRLLRSLSPGVGPAAENPDQVLKAGVGEVVCGTNVVYAGRFHRDRPLWPGSGELPPAWAEAVTDAGEVAVGVALETMLRAEGAR